MRILLIEDDTQFSDALAFQLQQEHIQTDLCTDGEEALSYIMEMKNAYDVILLDRMLPRIDGIALLKKIRQRGNHTPVIMLTAMGEVNDRITGLDSGADDYLVKPFEFDELMARIRCIRRRPTQWMEKAELSFADISYDPDSHVLCGKTKNCTLSRTEGALFDFLIRNPNQILPRDTILSHIWGPYGNVEDGNLDNYIYFVRRRLRHVSSLTTIKTIRGVGYQLTEHKEKDKNAD